MIQENKTQEVTVDFKQVVELLKAKGFNSAGLFYGKGGPTGIKLTKSDVEKLVEILNK